MIDGLLNFTLLDENASAIFISRIVEQDGRLAPAYFSPNYKYFDQLLQTVKNKTTVLKLVFNEFLQTSIPPLISVPYAKRYQDFPLKNFCLTVPKIFLNGPSSVSLILGIEKKLGINRKDIWHNRDSNPEPTAWEPCCPNPTAAI